MLNTFGPELDAELAYRREALLRGTAGRRGATGRSHRSWRSRMLRHETTGLVPAQAGRRGPRPA